MKSDKPTLNFSSFSILFFIAFYFIGHFPLKGQNESLNDGIQSNAVITVPNELYNTITSWLESGGKDIKLSTYLYQNYEDSDVVSDFLSDYMSGNTGYSSNKTTVDTTCKCKTIRPVLGITRKSINPNVSVGYLEKKGGVLGGHQHAAYHKYSDGPAVNMRNYVGGDDGDHQYSTHINTGFVNFDFLQLCTEMFSIHNECNCNKVLELSSTYDLYYDYTGGSSGFLSKHGRWGLLEYAYGVFSFDNKVLKTNQATTLYVHDIHIKQNQWNTHIGVNPSMLLNTATSLRQMALHNVNYSAGIINIVDQRSFPEIITSVSVVSTAIDLEFNKMGKELTSVNGSSSKTRNFNSTGHLTLTANVPKTIVYASVTTLATGGMGTTFNSEIKFKSSFYTTHLIPNQTAGYNAQGTLLGEGMCCNEAYGHWWVSKDYRNNGQANQFALVKKELNQGGIHLWNNSITNYQTNINTATVNKPNILSIDHSEGEVESIDYCGCDELRDPITNFKLIEPDIYSQNTAYCGTPFTISDIKFNTINPGMVNVYWNKDGVLIPGSQGMNQITVNAAGIYTVVYEEASSSLCKTYDYIQIVECGSGLSMEQVKSSRVKIFPNPSSDQLVITSNHNCELELYRPTGKQILHYSLKSGRNEIPVESLNEGVYILKISKQGRLFHTEKWIKIH